MTKANKETTAEIRLEDLGKQLLAKAEPVELKIVEEVVAKYIEKTKDSAYLLYGKEIGYFQLFLLEGERKNFAPHLIDFMEESCYVKTNENGEVEFVDLTDVRFIEDEKDIDGLSIWIGTVYFQLIPQRDAIEVVK